MRKLLILAIAFQILRKPNIEQPGYEDKNDAILEITA